MLQIIQTKDLPVSKRTRSQTSVLLKDYDKPEKDPYISATEFENFCNNDKIIDWFSVLSKNYILEEQDKEHPLSFLFKTGSDYENKIVEEIRNKTGLSLEKMTSVKTSREYNDLKNRSLETYDYNRLYTAMFLGEPIIYSGYLKDDDERLRGIPDLLIRNDYVEKLFDNKYNINEYKSNFGNYYYIPIEIKFSSVTLQSENKIKDSEDCRFLFYKTQLFTYCKILHKIQGVFPDNAFIIGKRTVLKNKEIKNSLEYPGFINYRTYDNHIVDVFYNGLKWLRDVKKNGLNWSLNPSLYPNMKKSHYLYDKDKKEISDLVGEITDIWYCSYKKRENAFKNGIYSWRDYRLNSDILEVPEHTKEAVDNILKINRGELGDYYPTSFKNKDNINMIKESDNNIFIDFETVRDSLDIDTYGLDEKIFLIGTWYKGQYKSFLINEMNEEEERRIINEFLIYLKENNNPTCWYWYAEVGMFKRALERLDIYSNYNFSGWNDLFKVFKEENFVVKGCKNFKLKSYIKNLLNLSLIQTEIQPEECSSGIDAMIMAWRNYNEEKNEENMKYIIKYNKLDCEYLEVLLNFIKDRLLL